MKELRYFAAVVALGVATVTLSAYQIEKLDLASANTDADELSFAAPDVLVPETAAARTVAIANKNSRNRAEVETTRVSTAQRDKDFVTSISRRDGRGAL